jgi:hypothetical protein
MTILIILFCVALAEVVVLLAFRVLLNHNDRL